MIKNTSVLFLLLFASIHYGTTFSGENSVTITLKNKTILLKSLQSWKFPDVESFFGVKGKNVIKLEIRNSKLAEFTKKELKKLPNLESLVVTFNKHLKKVNSRVFQWNPRLIYLNFERNNLDYIAPDAFHGLFQQRGFNGDLLLMHNNLRHLPLFQDDVPDLKILSISDNPIESIREDAFRNMTNLQTLHMKNTKLKSLPGHLFQTLPYLHELRLSGNKDLHWLDPNVFVGASGMKKLYLDGTAIDFLPSDGLSALTTLELKDTKNLWAIPNGILAIATLKTVHVSANQRFLCCAFEMKRALVGTFVNHGGSTTQPSKNLCPQVTPTTSIFTTTATSKRSVTTKKTSTGITQKVSTTEDPINGFGKKRKRRFVFGGFISGTKTPSNLTTIKRIKETDDFFGGDGFITKIVTYSEGSIICNPNNTGRIHYNKLSPVKCTPEPDALRPCDDIMGNVFLTAISWLVSVVALLGNSMVFSVLILSRRTLTVTKFLLINLSFADLCLALYLFILVSASGHTHGDYYNYVKRWQYGGGCGVSGFLAIFSSQLSMLVLVVTTIERYFAIVYAMHFHRRLSMKHAKICMLVCWSLAMLMATLPLVGVNSYDEVAICLPFKTSGNGDLAYIGILLLMNVIFFIFVLAAYIRMYCVVRSPHLEGGPQRNDSEVAKRMALLVFTDFFCWGPIAFVGLMSVFGSHDLLNMDVKKSKYLLVIFFPINALCNPFLYAVSTNSFKRDFFDLLIRCGLCQDSISKVNEGVYTNSVSQKNSRHVSESMSLTYNSQVSRGSVGKKNQSLLPNLLISRHNRSSNSPLVSASATPNDEFRSMLDQDDVFYSQNLKQEPSAQNDDVPVMETNFSNNVINDDVSSSNRSRPLTAYDTVDEKRPTTLKDRSVSADSDTRENQALLDNHTPGFSQYDLSEEAFTRAKETNVLL